MTPEQIEQYIGRPWVAGEHDCWAFFRHCQKTYYGIDVPVVDIDAFDLKQIITTIGAHEERKNWQLVGTPQDGDAVLMVRNKYPSHIGLWVDIDGGRVLHCAEGAGVLCQTVAAVAQMGWPKLEFYRRK